MITLMPHLRIGPYKEGVLIAQIQMPFYPVGRSFPYELLILPIVIIQLAMQYAGKIKSDKYVSKISYLLLCIIITCIQRVNILHKGRLV